MKRSTVKTKKNTPAPSQPQICPVCGQAMAAGRPHAKHGYGHLKMQIEGFLKPGESLHRNMLFDALYAHVPKDPNVHVQIYNYEIAPRGFTNWHIHMGATFYLTLQGLFEGHFEEGVLVKGRPGEVYSEPIGKVHRGHNPHAEIVLQGIGIALTAPDLDAIINVAPPAWAPTTG